MATVVPAAEPTPALAARDKSALGRALADGSFAVVAEIAAPRGLDLEATVAQARRFRDLGALAVNVPDYPRSGARVSALALAGQLERNGIETLLHYICRDRTLRGAQSDLAAAHVMGIRNVLATTGSPGRSGDYPDDVSHFDIDAIGLMKILARLNEGLDVAGEALGETTRFLVGATVNPFAADPDAEWRRLDQKVEAGVDFILTPPVLDPESFEPVLDRLCATGRPVLAGVVTLENARHAELISSEVVGVRASEAILSRLRGATDQTREAAIVTTEITSWLRTRVQGLVLTWLHGTASTAEQALNGAANE